MPVDFLVKSVEGLPDGLCVPFVDSVSPDLRCSLCSGITERVMSDPEGHIYCPPCVALLTDMDNRFTCSVCNFSVGRGMLMEKREIANTVKGLMVLCPNNCSFRNSLGELKTHFQSCRASQQDLVSCPLCGDMLTKKGVPSHYNHCKKVPASCPFCRCSIEVYHMEQHKLSCDSRPDSCEYCRQSFPTHRDLRQDHLPYCEYRPNPCAYQPLGCDFKGVPSALREHEAQTSHGDLVCKRFYAMDTALKDTKKLFNEEHERLRTSLDELFAKNMTLETTVQDLQKQLEEKSRQSAEMCARFENLLQGVQAQVKKTQEGVGECRQSFQTAMKELALIGPEFKYVWKIQPYRYLQQVTEAAENKYINSTVVSTGSPGYRFMFTCKLTGPYLSVYMKIHSGEDDDLLPWPFAGRIIVTLKSQTDPQMDIDRVINPKVPDIADCFKKPQSCGYNAKFGFTEFARIPLIENVRKGFLVDDCIVLQFSILPSVDPPVEPSAE
uniref:Putative tnf receptor-associated factor 6 n=1 Tax=Ornithodoros turicata TaxID=34597 RepID=A0A2R5L7U0_9ACAR